MNTAPLNRTERNTPPPSATPAAWVFAFGCSVICGAILMPGTGFLSDAGPVAVIVGLVLMLAMMLAAAANVLLLMKRNPEADGSYAFTRNLFGHDYGLLTAWFLGAAAVAMISLCALGLPMAVSGLLGGFLQFGPLYEIAGMPVYLGEILLSVLVLGLAAVLCFRRAFSARTWSVLSLVLLLGTALCLIAGFIGGNAVSPFRMSSAPAGAASVIFRLAFLCASAAGLIGCFSALGRLFAALSDDGLLPGWFGRPEDGQPPRNAVFLLLGVSVLPLFFGRAAAGWIMPPAAVGVGIAYAVVSAAARKSAKAEKHSGSAAVGACGFCLLVLLVLFCLLPGLVRGTGIPPESYLLLALWSLLGIVMLRCLLPADREQRLGKAVFPRALLLLMTIFTAAVWFLQATGNAIGQAQPYQGLLIRNTLILLLLTVLALAFMMEITSFLRRRDRQAEIDRAVSAESGRVKASFIANMSHEIRTPMNSIIGINSIVLRNPDLKPQTREQLENVGASARHLLDLMNDMLEIGRIESGVVATKKEDFSLRVILEQLNSVMNAKCAQKGLNYECSIVGEVSNYYSGDDTKLQKVLSAILDNAAKFTDAPGQVRMVVEQLGTADGGCRLRFTVRDTGIGIDEAFLPKIFESFSQEDSTSTSRFGGSGLGLAIAKQYATMMGGDIQVESRKGEGSVFTVTVPLKISEHTVFADSDLRLPPDMRAAVVDSDPEAGEHARLVLKAIGVTADCFADPWEAIESIRGAHRLGNGYGLVITSYRMPGMNGLELARMIREFDGGKTAIIMLTGYNWDLLEDEAVADGVDSIGAKPLFPDSLLKEIDSILARKEGRAVPEESGTDAVILAGRRILIAEDIELNAEVLRDLLDLEDIRSERAANGKKALEMFSARPAGYYDAILMDIRMPVMDGLRATEEIRALERPDAKTIPIIALSANVYDEDVQSAKDAGMNAHLPKPVDADQLYKTLATFIAAAE